MIFIRALHIYRYFTVPNITGMKNPHIAVSSYREMEYLVIRYRNMKGQRAIFSDSRFIIMCPIHIDDCLWESKDIPGAMYCDKCQDLWRRDITELKLETLTFSDSSNSFYSWLTPSERFTPYLPAPLFEERPARTSPFFKLGEALLKKVFPTC
jgi:hypothetical protein